VVFPTGTSTRTALADGHFRLAEREKPEPVRPEDAPERYEGYPGELTYPTQHQGDFVFVEGERHRTWIAQRGLPEYELLDLEEETHVAVTLHRSVGWLSVEGGRIRRCQAGPTVPTPGAQCLREMGGELSFGTGPVSRAAVVRHARSFAHPAWIRELPDLPHVDGEGRHPRRQSLLQIEGEGIELSAWKPGETAGTSVLRLWNRTGQRRQATVRFGEPIASAFKSWMPVSLTEERGSKEGRPFDSVLELELSPHEIRTVRLGVD
jgi:mannosylglycerate hydrolase